MPSGPYEGWLSPSGHFLSAALSAPAPIDGWWRLVRLADGRFEWRGNHPATEAQRRFLATWCESFQQPMLAETQLLYPPKIS